MVVLLGDPRAGVPPVSDPPAFSVSYIDSIQSQTNREVTISPTGTAKQLSKCRNQDQSPFFSMLPSELRLLIFEYATAPYQDPAHQDDDAKTYKTTDFFYRPEHPGKLVTSTNLLLTCRRIWLEANHLPLKQAEHVFYFFNRDRRPRWTTSNWIDDDDRLRDFLTSLTYGNRQNLEHIRVFPQMFWLEREFIGKVDHFLGRFGAAPRVLTLTLRYTDWWNWESNQDLYIDTKWVQALLDSPTLPRVQELRLELETTESKMAQLRPIVENIRHLEPLVRRTLGGKDDIRHCWTLQTSPPEKTWSGPGCLGPQTARHQRQRTHNWTTKGEGTLKYRIVTIVWKSVEVDDKPTDTPTVEACGDLNHQPFVDKSSQDTQTFDDKLAASLRQQWSDKWEEQGSLLEFLPDDSSESHGPGADDADEIDARGKFWALGL
ncbi:Hypothetical protein R9X50_00403100 [Acrodontium crateriforme]|uniref:Uncharacterized protein n=1 Tax=Acrodontium crateriforme TaxID=150365 RepID=A0AAQ3M4K7_9PEZI|nr:Hypothetical protein R9X50_00403100 [Acrodontium crateriforme]